MHRTIRYRLHPRTKAKAETLLGLAGACRFAWNHFVAKLQREYETRGARDDLSKDIMQVYPAIPWNRHTDNNFRFYSLCKEFTAMRQETDWLQGYSCALVRASLKPIQTAYQEFFKDPKERGLPRFKARHHTDPSFPLPPGAFRAGKDFLHIQRIGQVKISGSNPYPDCPVLSGQVRQEAGKWYAYLVYEVPEEERTQEGAIGIDRNVKQIATSNGDIIHLPNIDRLEARKRRYQRVMAGRTKGSNRRKRVALLLLKTCRKIAKTRADWAHQTSRQLANRHKMAIVEDLKVKAMTAKGKGKHGLNREIRDSVWGRLKQMLDYKMEVQVVNPAYTSQRCHKCGHTAKANRQSQAQFICQSCAYSGNADINAALNILASGIGASARGDSEGRKPGRRSVKREIDFTSLEGKQAGGAAYTASG